MKTALLFLFASYVIWPTDCYGQLLPSDTWSQDCVELAPYQGTDRLTGLCCTSITFPQIDLGKNRFFLVIATYYTFNGTGLINFPLVVNGELSAGGKVLTLSYWINGALTTHVLKRGKAVGSCHCVCD